jgi:hypothetical protein
MTNKLSNPKNMMQNRSLTLLIHTKHSVKHQMAKVATPLLISTAMVAVSTANVEAAFIGYYSPSNWNFTTTSNGTLNRNGAPNSIELTGGDNQSGSPGTTDFTIAAPASGTWQFNWSYFSFDNAPNGDSGGYLLNGNFTELARNSDVINNPPALDFISLSVSQGDIIGYRVSTLDNISAFGQLTVSNFSAPAPTAAVPYNFSPGLGIGLLGAWVGVGKLRKSLQNRRISPKVPS